jgi:hypothetical protein
MTTWDVIEEAMLRRRPARTMKWLAEELGERIQTVSNWKARGVPVRRLREIGQVLGLTVDQLEGVAPLPWAEDSSAPEMDPEVAEAAAAINRLPPAQRRFVLMAIRNAMFLAQQGGLSHQGNSLTQMGDAESFGATAPVRKVKGL